LSHLNAEAPAAESGALQILRINRNALVLIDSDRSGESGAINATKKRIVAEIEEVGGSAWVTAGRTVENYLPTRVSGELLGIAEIPVVDPFERFESYLNRLKAGEGDRFLRKKADFAYRAAPKLTAADLSILDLALRINDATARIRRWNNMSPATPA
jgi:putative ATP-dependent endonuclease of OLD family